MVQTAQAFNVTPPPPKAVERQDAAPIGSHITRRLTVTLVEPGAGTLQAAYDAASAGDVLELRDGTYTGSGSGSDVLRIAKGIELRAQNAGMAVIDGEDARRCIRIDSGTVGLWGLNITRGRASVSARLLALPEPSSITPLDETSLTFRFGSLGLAGWRRALDH